MDDFAPCPGTVHAAATLNGSNGHDDIPPGLLLRLMQGQERSTQDEPRRADEKVDGHMAATAH